jgi:hypothetical protein
MGYRQSGGVGLSLTIGAFGLCIFFSGPREIKISQAGVTQKSYFGFRVTRIPWEGMAASHLPEIQELLVVGRDGTTITHTQYHVAQNEFANELRFRGVFFHGDKVA